MHGRRCKIGCESWPDNAEEYGTCPSCGEETFRYSNLRPLPEAEARSRKNHLLFEEFYEEWDSSHSSLRLSPALITKEYEATFPKK